MIKNILFAIMALGLVFSTACSQPAEEETNSVDMEDVKEAAEEAGDTIMDTAEEAGDAIEDAVEDVEDEM